MANMSYCRFHNTRLDLEDCIEALRNEERLSSDEAKAGRHLFDDFLSFCVDQGIIDSFDSEEVEILFGRLEQEDDDDDWDCEHPENQPGGGQAAPE